jgi:hypothetical protein
MGTNYYVAKNLCECCNRYDEEYHIGKSSGGWASLKAGKEFLKDQIIMDEYKRRIDYNWFVQMIETYKSPGHIDETGHKNLLHNEEGKKGPHPYFNPEYDWDDEDGYSFSSREFF